MKELCLSTVRFLYFRPNSKCAMKVNIYLLLGKPKLT